MLMVIWLFPCPDILDHTPEDVPTRSVIAQALDEALRIAEKCDRAQGNAAFLRRA